MSRIEAREEVSEILNVAHEAYSEGGDVYDVVFAVWDLISAQALRDAADAIPLRSGMSKADADLWLHHRANEILGLKQPDEQ